MMVGSPRVLEGWRVELSFAGWMFMLIVGLESWIRDPGTSKTGLLTLESILDSNLPFFITSLIPFSPLIFPPPTSYDLFK